jgi:hypothetical protein
MKHGKNREKTDRKVISFLTYASSSVVFDVVAYSLSGKISKLAETHAGSLIYSPSLIISYGAAKFSSLLFGTGLIGRASVIIVILPIVTFFFGAITHRAFSRRIRPGKGASQGD